MEKEREREIEREQELESSVLRVPRWCVMAQRGGNTDVGIRCPLRPVPIPSTAITYNNDGLVEARGRSDFSGEERKRKYRGVGTTIASYRRVYGPRDDLPSLLLCLALSRSSRRYRESRDRRMRRLLARENENSVNPGSEILRFKKKNIIEY